VHNSPEANKYPVKDMLPTRRISARSPALADARDVSAACRERKNTGGVNPPDGDAHILMLNTDSSKKKKTPETVCGSLGACLPVNVCAEFSSNL